MTETAGTLEATARWTAAVRAREDARADRLFADPWAAALAGEAGAAWLAARTPGSETPIVLRTRYFDDWLTASVREGDQVVLLAAGLDTRAWRLPWPAGVTLFEVDREAVLDHKAAAMAGAGAVPACERRAVAADLGGDWAAALVAAGFSPDRRSVILAEGVLFYLPEELVHRVLAAIGPLAAPGSRLGFDIVNSVVLVSPYTKAWVEMQAAAGAPWLGTLDDPVAELDALSWTAVLAQAGEPEANHGRWTLPVIPQAVPGMPRNWYVTAERRG